MLRCITTTALPRRYTPSMAHLLQGAFAPEHAGTTPPSRTTTHYAAPHAVARTATHIAATTTLHAAPSFPFRANLPLTIVPAQHLRTRCHRLHFFAVPHFAPLRLPPPILHAACAASPHIAPHTLQEVLLAHQLLSISSSSNLFSLDLNMQQFLCSLMLCCDLACLLACLPASTQSLPAFLPFFTTRTYHFYTHHTYRGVVVSSLFVPTHTPHHEQLDLVQTTNIKTCCCWRTHLYLAFFSRLAFNALYLPLGRISTHAAPRHAFFTALKTFYHARTRARLLPLLHTTLLAPLNARCAPRGGWTRTGQTFLLTTSHAPCQHLASA